MIVKSLNIGLPKQEQFHGKEFLTGMCKQPVSGAVFLSKLGFEGDGVGDQKHHGGEDKAVCVYSLDHYPYWGINAQHRDARCRVRREPVGRRAAGGRCLHWRRLPHRHGRGAGEPAAPTMRYACGTVRQERFCQACGGFRQDGILLQGPHGRAGEGRRRPGP